MVASPKHQYLSPAEYFDWEERQDVKYEYIDGEVFAMTGGSIPHANIVLNLASALKIHLRGGPCCAFIFNVKLGISEQGPFHYPDVMVSCDDRDRNATKVIYYPCLIAEVLSPSTEAGDRGRKFANYRRISILQEYMLIDAQQISLECFRRNEQNKWELNTYSGGEEVHLTSVDYRCNIESLYENVQFSDS